MASEATRFTEGLCGVPRACPHGGVSRPPPGAACWLAGGSSQRLGFSAAPVKARRGPRAGVTPTRAAVPRPKRPPGPTEERAAMLKTGAPQPPPSTDVPALAAGPRPEAGLFPSWAGGRAGGGAACPPRPFGRAPAPRGGHFQRVAVGKAAEVTLLLRPPSGGRGPGRRGISRQAVVARASCGRWAAGVRGERRS